MTCNKILRRNRQKRSIPNGLAMALHWIRMCSAQSNTMQDITTLSCYMKKKSLSMTIWLQLLLYDACFATPTNVSAPSMRFSARVHLFIDWLYAICSKMGRSSANDSFSRLSFLFRREHVCNSLRRLTSYGPFVSVALSKSSRASYGKPSLLQI